MTAPVSLSAIREQAEGLTDLCPEHLRQSIRHVQRNCDIDCNTHEDDPYACKQPDRYDGERMANALASIPGLLVALERVEALHPRTCEINGDKGCEHGDTCPALVCGPCGEPWPCPTIEAITGGGRVRFTWLTYRVAIRRAFNQEYQAFCDHTAAFRGPDPWIRAMWLTTAIKKRQIRESGRTRNDDQ